MRIIGFLLFCFLFFSFKQDSPIFTIKTNIDFFEVDNLENIYTIYESEIDKFTPSGKLFSKYSNLRLGNISSVDATNPLKILVYYKDYQQLVFLDNQLSDNGDNISLEKLGYEQAELVCASANNSFWLFNKQNNELLRFNEKSKKVSSSGNLVQLLKAELQPTFMVENNGYLYLNCPQQGIFVFDIFGTYVKTIGLTKQNRIKIKDNLVYYKTDSSYCSFDSFNFELNCKTIPINTNFANFFKSKLYIASKTTLSVYNVD